MHRLFCGTLNTNGQKSCDISKWLAIDRLVPTPPDLFVIGYSLQLIVYLTRVLV